MTENIKIGDKVVVGPNIDSVYAQDHDEAPWTGVVVRINGGGEASMCAQMTIDFCRAMFFRTAC
jgi:hypothetical protein